MALKPRKTLSRIWRTMLAAALFLAVSLLSTSTHADDWMFRPSFYSHAPNPALEAMAPRPESRSAYRLPIISNGPGFAIRGGYRYNTMVIQSGNSYDVTIFRQNWFEATP